MKRLHFISFVLFFSATTLLAQNKDSLAVQLQRDSLRIFRKTAYRLFARIENRNSAIGGKPVDLYGFMLGVNVHQRHVLAAGFYLLGRESYITRFFFDDVTIRLRRLNYYNFSYQPILIQQRYFQVNLPLELGIGSYELTEYMEGLAPEFIHGRFAPASIGLQIIMKPVSWAGVSILGGYRTIPLNRQFYNFNGMYYSYGIWVDMRYLYRKARFARVKKHYRRQLQETR